MAVVEACEPEFIDGSYYGCGSCPDCLEEEDQEIEAAVEMGQMTDAQAMATHAANDQRRTLLGLYDDEECG